LKLEALDAKAARYSCLVLQPGAEHVGSALVRLQDGQLELCGLDAVPEHALTVLSGVLRSAYRNAPEAGWPRRITRWRKD
jgi:hypothetical protein